VKDSKGECMCGGGPYYHKAEKVLSCLEAEIDASLAYIQGYINDESLSFEFRRKIFQRLVRLQSSFKVTSQPDETVS
jgi:hypothetical protein